MSEEPTTTMPIGEFVRRVEAIRKDFLTHVSSTSMTEIDLLLRESLAIAAELEHVRHRLAEAAMELPEIAGPVAHRIRKFREMYSDEIAKERERAEKAEAERDAAIKARDRAVAFQTEEESRRYGLEAKVALLRDELEQALLGAALTRAAKAEAGRDEARKIADEYMRHTDPVIACGPGDDPSAGACGTCRACLLEYREKAEALLRECRELLERFVNVDTIDEAMHYERCVDDMLAKLPEPEEKTK